MYRNHFFCLLLVAIIAFGCHTVPQQEDKPRQAETRQDVETAVGSVINTMKGKRLQSKYCPVCGKHYGPSREFCVLDGTKLREVEE